MPRPGNGMPARFGRWPATVFAAVLAAGVAVCLSPAHSGEGEVPAFSSATVIKGSAAERGQAYGARFREPIREFLEKEIYGAFAGKPSTREQMLQYAAACRKVVRAE